MPASTATHNRKGRAEDAVSRQAAKRPIGPLRLAEWVEARVVNDLLSREEPKAGAKTGAAPRASEDVPAADGSADLQVRIKQGEATASVHERTAAGAVQPQASSELREPAWTYGSAGASPSQSSQ